MSSKICSSALLSQPKTSTLMILLIESQKWSMICHRKTLKSEDFREEEGEVILSKMEAQETFEFLYLIFLEDFLLFI